MQVQAKLKLQKKKTFNRFKSEDLICFYAGGHVQ